MQKNQIIFLFFMMCLSAAGMAFYFWRRSTSLYSLLVEGANRFEEMRQRLVGFELKAKENDQKLREFYNRTQSAEKAFSEMKSSLEEARRNLEAKTSEIQYVTDKLERQKSYLESVVSKQKEQIESMQVEHEKARQLMEGSLGALIKSKDFELSKLKDEYQVLESKYHQTITKDRDHLTKVEKELNLLKIKSAEFDPVEAKRLKRRIAQYARLFQSMKGLKEMAEERNQNWEVALRRLSVHILENKKVAPTRIPNDIGPLVGTALKLIGQQLIHDDEMSGHGMEEGELGVSQSLKSKDETIAAVVRPIIEPVVDQINKNY